MTPRIVRATANFAIEGQACPRLPLIVDANGRVHEAANDYIRHMAVDKVAAPTTINEYAKTLCMLLIFLAAQGTSWDMADDSLLRKWRNWMTTRGHLPAKKARANWVMRVVFQFYWWAELGGYLSGVVGQSDSRKGKKFPITVDIRISGDGANVSTRASSRLLYRTTRKPDDRNPTQIEISRLHAALAEHKLEVLNVRNTLMARWAEEGMLRRKEFALLTTAQIPSMDSISEHYLNGTKASITLFRTKGEKERVITVDPYLLEDTRQYILTCRSLTVERFKRRNGKSYEEPAEVFISEKTGKALVLNSITNFFKHAQKRGGVRRANPHRLRSVGATNLIDNIIDWETAKHGRTPDFSTVLLRAKEELGHASERTTLRYYRRAVARKLERGFAQADLAARTEKRVQEALRKLERANKEVKAHEMLRIARDLLLAGDHAGALKALGTTTGQDKRAGH